MHAADELTSDFCQKSDLMMKISTLVKYGTDDLRHRLIVNETTGQMNCLNVDLTKCTPIPESDGSLTCSQSTENPLRCEEKKSYGSDNVCLASRDIDVMFYVLDLLIL